MVHNTKNNPKDALFITLSIFHLPTKFENHGIIFRMKAHVCKKIVRKSLCITGLILKTTFIRDVSIDDFDSVEINFLLTI